MKLKKCEYCGTEFDATLSQCPLCGKAVQPGAAEPQPVMPAAYKPAGGHGGKFSKKKGGGVSGGRTTVSAPARQYRSMQEYKTLDPNFSEAVF